MEVLKSWAAAEWFTNRPEVPKKIEVTVFKVDGETNTDDLSPTPGTLGAGQIYPCMPRQCL